MKNKLGHLFLFLISAGLKIYAQPSSDYLKSMNSFVPGSPESAQMMKYLDYPVNLFTGTPEISIPIYNLTGKGISVPITMSYHAGGGIKVDELATNIGLGWSLLAGGEITREIRGDADEGITGSGFLNKPQPISYYMQQATCCTGIIPSTGNVPTNHFPNQGIWVDAMKGLIDLEPDIFYFSFGGKSGKFVWDDSTNQFLCLTDNQHLNISFMHSNIVASSFTIISDDGNKYFFSDLEVSNAKTTNLGTTGSSAVAGNNETTSWKLSKIVNADATDSVMFTYEGQNYTYSSDGANIIYQSINGPVRPPIRSYSDNHITGYGKLSNISGKNFSVTFTNESNNRIDLPGSKALSKIIVKNGNNEIQDIFVLHHSYFTRDYALSSIPQSDQLKKSLRLDSISEYGNSETNTSPLRHTFTYDGHSLPYRASYAKDWWGYANYNDYGGEVPAPVINDGLPHEGANRKPDINRMKASILTSIKLPTGGTVNYEYEPNTTAIPVAQSLVNGNNILHVTQLIAEQITGNQIFHDSTIKFTINVPANAATNNMEEGVIANIGFYPQGPPLNNGFSSMFPIYSLRKEKELNGDDPYPLSQFDAQLQSSGLYQVHLPNGKYIMHLNTYNYNQNLPYYPPGDGNPPGNTITYSVSYDMPDTIGRVNYSLAGLRVKSITTLDPYANIVNKRNFRYHNPENDSSFGYYIGPSRNDFVEVTQDGVWRVKMGTFNMPGAGNAASNVVYPIVYEDVSENGIIRRTEHYFSLISVPHYFGEFPFTPVFDVECARGNEYKTVWDKYTNLGFVPARIKQQNFNFLPKSFVNPIKSFDRTISAIKCACSSYESALVLGNGYPPPYVVSYAVNVNRLYLTSDSITTYDLDNQNRSIKEWHDYTYGDLNHQPVITRSGNSDGSINKQENYFAADYPGAPMVLPFGSFAWQLSLTNRVNQLLGTKTFKDNTLLNQQKFYGHFDDTKMLIDSMQYAISGNPLETEIRIPEYDNNANPLTVALRGDKYRKYIWNKKKGLALATCVSAKKDDYFHFTSFEYPEDNGIAGNAFSGSKAYQLSGSSTLNFNGATALTNEDVFVWATNGIPLVNNAAMVSTGKTKGTWTLYRSHISGGSTVTISGSALIDQLVILPTGSTFQGNIYDAANRIVAIVNDQMETNYFDYDTYSRPSAVKDEKGNVIKGTVYQYQGAQ